MTEIVSFEFMGQRVEITKQESQSRAQRSSPKSCFVYLIKQL